MKENKIQKPIGSTVWFKILLTLLMFLPPITQIPFDSINTTAVIAQVLSHPLAVSIPALLPIAKLLLLSVAIIPFVHKGISQKYVLLYYGFALVLVGIFQNMAQTESYGFVWLMGNTLVQLIIAVYCFYDVHHAKTTIKRENLNRKRLWVLAPMLLALLMPYAINAQGIIKPAIPVSILWNEAGVTYCMITPVIIGLFLLFSKDVYKPLLSALSYVGLSFGIFNMMTWFLFQNQNWWMGVLHLPLLILAIYGLRIAKKEIQNIQ